MYTSLCFISIENSALHCEDFQFENNTQTAEDSSLDNLYEETIDEGEQSVGSPRSTYNNQACNPSFDQPAFEMFLDAIASLGVLK